MTLEERKLKLIKQLSTTEDKKLIKQIEDILKESILEEYQKTLKPMSEKEFEEKIKAAEEDIKSGRTFTQKQVELFMKTKFKK